MISKILLEDGNRSLVEEPQTNFELKDQKVLTVFEGEEGERAETERDPGLSKISIILLTFKGTEDDIYWKYEYRGDTNFTKACESREQIKFVKQMVKYFQENRSRTYEGFFSKVL